MLYSLARSDSRPAIRQITHGAAVRGKRRARHSADLQKV